MRRQQGLAILCASFFLLGASVAWAWRTERINSLV